MGLYPGLVYDTVLGSDCCGELVSIDPSDGVSAMRLAGLVGTGADVVVNPACAWGPDDERPDAHFHILGMPTAGTFCEYVAVSAAQVHPKPAHLTAAEAAALPLAGLTAFRACFRKAMVEAADVVLITGIGGGVALLALQFCLAAGAREVWVTSSSDAKITRAVALGAAGGFNYAEADWAATMGRALRGRLTKVVDGAGGAGLNSYIKVMRTGGVIATYGATARNPKRFDITRLFLKNIELRGSTMGSPRDFESMLSFVRRHAIVPIVDSVVALRCSAGGASGAEDTGRALAAFERMRAGQQMGKIVFAMGQSVSDSARPAAAGAPAAKL